jgi:hypothetical protein
MSNLLHRYKIWQHNGADPAAAQLAAPPATRQVEDLVALMALYDYRPWLDVELRGTCSVNGNAAKCKTTSISPEAVNLVYEAPSGAPSGKGEMKTGSSVQLDLEQIGHFRGVVASKKAEAVQVAVADKQILRSKLSRMAAEHAVNLYEGKRPASPKLTKIEPAIKACSFIDHTGTMRRGVIVNMSQVDALIKARIVPPVRSRIMFSGARKQPADVVKSFEMGFAARFCTVIPAEEFSTEMKLTDD